MNIKIRPTVVKKVSTETNKIVSMNVQRGICNILIGDDLQLAFVRLDQSAATIYPISDVAVDRSIIVLDARSMDVSANHSVVSASLRRLDRGRLKSLDVDRCVLDASLHMRCK